MLSEIFGEANSLDVWVCSGEFFDDIPNIVWAAIGYEDEFVVGAGRVATVSRISFTTVSMGFWLR